MSYTKYTWVTDEVITASKLNHIEEGLEKASVTGTDRQVLGYVDGEQEAVTLGWKQFSDLPTPPPFSNGVLTGTAFNSDGSAFFAFVELALGEGGTSMVKPNSIPFYNPGQIGTGGGTLAVADGIEDNEAVNVSQLNALIARVEALENA